MKTIQGRFRAAVFIGAAAAVLAFASAATAQTTNASAATAQTTNNNAWPYATTGNSPVLAVVGDISCQPGEEVSGEAADEVCTDPATPPAYTSTSLWQSQEATANQIEAMKPDAVALLGDLQYQVGRYSDFEGSFDLTYGAFKFLQRPAPGNHEFYNEHGETGVAGYGYFSYFNGFQLNSDGSIPMTTIQNPCPVASSSCKAAGAQTLFPQPIPRQDGQAGHFGTNGNGWYSYNLGNWHLISLNIECYTQPGGCSNNGSWFAAELAWLQQDLEQNNAPCTAAYWHQPLYSAANSITQEGTTSQQFWELLYRYHADLVLNGHDHLYARYRPLDPSGNYDPNKGIREFIVGTGGETLDTVVYTTTLPSTDGADAADLSGQANFNLENIEAATGEFWGVMGLTLNPNGYAWDFESALKDPAQTTGPASFSDKGVGACHGPVNPFASSPSPFF
jgi:calcineurin-like phosphoesterase family protein